MSDLEKRILDGIISDPKLAMDFCSQYEAKYFLDPENRVVATQIIKYVSAYKSAPTKRAVIDFCNNKETAELIDKFWDNVSSYNSSEYNYDLSCLKKNYSNAQFEEMRAQFLKGTDQTQIIADVKKKINEIQSISGSKSYLRKTLKEYLPEFTDKYKAKVANPELGVGILTGYSMIDYVINGLRPADLVLICGISGSGKSQFMNNMAINIWKQQNTIDMAKEDYTKGFNVCYMSLEMPFEDCHQRTMAALSDVPSYHIRDAKLTRAEASAVSKANKFIKNFNYEFDIVDVPRGFTVQQLELEFERIKASYTPDVIFIDYMSLMESADADADDWLLLGALAGKIHEFARSHSIPVVTAAQLNRIDPAKIKNGNHIGQHRIGRSALITTHCTLILQIDDDQTYKNDVDTFKYHIIKARNGQDNISHSITKNFAHCAVRDLPFSESIDANYLEDVDISEALNNMRDDISDIIKNW